VYLKTLTLLNFRNYPTLSLSCDPQANLFVGENGQGKTNLLEAIYYLCVARSCREALDKDLILLGKDAFLIRGEGVSSTGQNIELELHYVRHTGKKVKINQQPQRNVSDLYGSLAAVIMSPDDRELIQGGPSCRRRFLDIAISQSSPHYLALLQDYRRVVRQRNEALRADTRHSDQAPDMIAWDMQLVRYGARIMQKRIEVVDRIREEVRRLHAAISNTREELEIAYAPSFTVDHPDAIEDRFRESLLRSAREERARGMTVIGPHRDDLTFMINGVTLQTYGSQGQHKTAAIALKCSEAYFLWEQLDAPPLLLLDDIFAELDANRTARLIELLPSFGQVFITAAKESDFGPYANRFQRFRVKAGALSSVQDA
jgi:DNA replication and repair protein RecF